MSNNKIFIKKLTNKGSNEHEHLFIKKTKTKKKEYKLKTIFCIFKKEKII